MVCGGIKSDDPLRALKVLQHLSKSCSRRSMGYATERANVTWESKATVSSTSRGVLFGLQPVIRGKTQHAMRHPEAEFQRRRQFERARAYGRNCGAFSRCTDSGDNLAPPQLQSRKVAFKFRATGPGATSSNPTNPAIRRQRGMEPHESTTAC